MNGFAEFRKIVGLSCEELEKITGYTRQGLDLAFKNMKNGKVNRKFLVCINQAINNSIQTETEKFESRMNDLRNLQEKLSTENY